MSEETLTIDGQAERMRAGRLALIAGVFIFGAKLAAYIITGSAAVLADAMESTVNIVSAGMLVMALAIAGRPPDEDHPYGHGKVEFLSAAVEGAAIAFAALIIVAEGIRELIEGPAIQSLDIGLIVLGGSALANAALGSHLVRIGRDTQSAALSADGRHVLADVWTSVGVIIGLFIVYLTGWLWADPLIAIAVGIHVAWEGYKLIKESLRGLMDKADPEIIQLATTRLESARANEWIDLHGLRCWRSGARFHFDLHMTVPRYFDVEQIHEIHDELKAALLDGDFDAGDAVVHFDACDATLCRTCAVLDCPVRSEAVVDRIGFTPERAIRQDETL
jgi:cation diffusion facilitator family transporter